MCTDADEVRQCLAPETFEFTVHVVVSTDESAKVG